MIPRLAHWMWFEERLPTWAAKNIATFQKLHSDWEVRIWQTLPDSFPDDLRELIERIPW